MSGIATTKASDRTIRVLYGLSAGFCQFRGCPRRLLGDDLTGRVFNVGQAGHVVGSERGPRGMIGLSSELRDDVENLMLLCYEHHRLVDVHAVSEYPRNTLLEMKREQEMRIARACGIPPESKSHILLYGANIGDYRTALGDVLAAQALVENNRYPADPTFRIQTLDDPRCDRDASYWEREREHLVGKFVSRVQPEIASGEDVHVSIFALAPQPLLTLLGSLVTQLCRVDVYQRHREPEQAWTWPGEHPSGYAPLEPLLTPPKSATGTPALLIGLSADVVPTRVEAVLGDASAIWQLSIPRPNQHCIRTPDDLVTWRTTAMEALNRIKAEHGQGETLHVFPAMPNAAAVCLGLVRQPKADMPLLIYDEIQGRGFVPAIHIE